MIASVLLATIFLCANWVFGQLFTRERPMVAGALSLSANVVCMVAATCLMEWKTPNLQSIAGSVLAMCGGLLVVIWK